MGRKVRQQARARAAAAAPTGTCTGIQLDHADGSMSCSRKLNCSGVALPHRGWADCDTFGPCAHCDGPPVTWVCDKQPAPMPKPRPAATADQPEKAAELVAREGFEIHPDGSLTPGHHDCGCSDPFGDIRRGMLTAQGIDVPDGVSNHEIATVDLINRLEDLYASRCAGPLVVHQAGAAECHGPDCPGVTDIGHTVEITDPCSLHVGGRHRHACPRCATRA